MWRHMYTNQISSFGKTDEHIKWVRVAVQSTTGSRGVRISSSNAGYTMLWGSVKRTGYLLHSPVSPSLPLPCVTVCHHISTALYTNTSHLFGITKQQYKNEFSWWFKKVKTLIARIKDLAHAKVTHHKRGNTWSKWPWRRWRQATRISPVTSVPFKIFHFLFVPTTFLPVHSFFLLHHSAQLYMHQYNITTQKVVPANCITTLTLSHKVVLLFPFDCILTSHPKVQLNVFR